MILYIPPSSYPQILKPSEETAHGGAGISFDTVKEQFAANELPLHDVDGEIVWVRVEPLKHNSPLIIGAFYRTPSEREVNQLNQLDKSLDQIYEITKNNESSTIILGGDFNVGDINWDSLTVSNASNNKAHCIKTLEIMTHFHLEQMQLTRLDNTLDLWLTNKPSLVRQCISIPGISDHYIVLTDSGFKAKINKKAPHKIHLWDKADWANLRSKTSIFSNNFLDTFNSRTVEKNYQEFSNHIKNVITEHVPSKMTSSRLNLPWFTSSLKRMCKKKTATIQQGKDIEQQW